MLGHASNLPRMRGDVNGREGRAADVWFAGLGLSLDGDPELCARWRRAAGPGSLTGAHARPALRVRCQLRGLTPGAAPASRGLVWTWNEPSGRVLAPRGEAHVRREDGGFAADVCVAHEPHAARLLLVGLVSLILSLQGGLILHAASVALDGEAIAFIGPSGAGKSTACRHVSAGAPFSVDRLALLPDMDGQRWLAHPLPGGSASEHELGAAARWLPLRAVLRVRASANGSRVEACPRAIAVLLARESAFQLGSGSAAEQALLGSLERLVHDVGVQRLHVRLGVELSPIVRRLWPGRSEDIT